MTANQKAKLYRLRQIIGDPKANPALEPIIPVSRSSWLDGVRSGRFPKPIKIGKRVVVWRSEDIERLVFSIKRGSSK